MMGNFLLVFFGENDYETVTTIESLRIDPSDGRMDDEWKSYNFPIE